MGLVFVGTHVAHPPCLAPHEVLQASPPAVCDTAGSESQRQRSEVDNIMPRIEIKQVTDPRAGVHKKRHPYRDHTPIGLESHVFPPKLAPQLYEEFVLDVVNRSGIRGMRDGGGEITFGIKEVDEAEALSLSSGFI